MPLQKLKVTPSTLGKKNIQSLRYSQNTEPLADSTEPMPSDPETRE